MGASEGMGAKRCTWVVKMVTRCTHSHSLRFTDACCAACMALLMAAKRSFAQSAVSILAWGAVSRYNDVWFTSSAP